MCRLSARNNKQIRTSKKTSTPSVPAFGEEGGTESGKGRGSQLILEGVNRGDRWSAPGNHENPKSRGGGRSHANGIRKGPEVRAEKKGGARRQPTLCHHTGEGKTSKAGQVGKTMLGTMWMEKNDESRVLRALSLRSSQ